MIDTESPPIQTLVIILKQIDGVTLGKCRRVCKKWKDCIDGADWLWHELCRKDFKHSSKIAKEKCGIDCDWYHIYKNLKMWSDVTSFDINVEEYQTFSHHDENHALEIQYNILPLRQYGHEMNMNDMSVLKRLPFGITSCLKLANNDYATIILHESGLFIQKTIDNITNMSEAFFKADNFILSGDTVYFLNNRDVYQCDIAKDNRNMTAKLIIRCDYNIKDIKYDNNVLHIFTDCGKIVNVFKDNSTEVKPINSLPEWVKQIKFVRAINDKNFVCYSGNFFKVETDVYQHSYLDFPPITAVFFYADVVLIGTTNGEILLYRLSSQKGALKPIFENLAVLPEGKYAVQLDVCERKCGPVIVAATFFEIYLIEIDFFPNDKQYRKRPKIKLDMYKRLFKLDERMRCYVAKFRYKQAFRRV
ncbi:hypothetical protein ABMA27_010183 [Loxostege sticticalis]|uniref:F-box domain-containing protein n=1 Tax=Loxostege sticticalis TaxID=481309 RepID=A0ABR3H4Y0_LOXSC